MLCSFRLVPERKIDTEIPESSRLEFLEKFLASNFALSNAEDNIFGPLRRYSRLNLVEKTICNSLKVPTAKCLGSDWLFCFITRCKSGSFKNPSETITGLSELYFRFRRFLLLVQTKKVISMKYSSSKSNWKSWTWVRFDLIFTRRVIYINSKRKPLTKFTSTSSSRSTEFKDILQRNIF